MPQDTKEQLSEYQGQLAGLARRAKAIVQLKPRSPAAPLKGRLPIQAVCDYKQMEVSRVRGGRGGGGEGMALCLRRADACPPRRSRCTRTTSAPC